MTKDAKFDRASILYYLLKRRPVSDKPKIIQYLRDSSNTDAANIIEGNNEISETESSSLTAKLPLEPGGWSGTSQLLKKEATTFAISKLLIEDGVLQSEHRILVEILKMHPLREDIPKVQFPNYPAWKRGLYNETLTPLQLFQNILQEWVRTNGNCATVGNLIYILKKEGLIYAAGKRIANIT